MNVYDHNQYRAKLVRVIDGDTIVFDIDLGLYITKRETVRLAGIDVYERFTHQGRLATTFVKTSLQMSPLIILKTVKGDTWGKYGRFLANVLFKLPGVACGLSNYLNLAAELKERNYAKPKY